MLAQRREAVNADRDRMSIGVQKLDETDEIVAGLQLVFNLTWKSLSLCLKWPCLQWATICASGAVDFLRS